MHGWLDRWESGVDRAIVVSGPNGTARRCEPMGASGRFRAPRLQEGWAVAPGLLLKVATGRLASSSQPLSGKGGLEALWSGSSSLQKLYSTEGSGGR